VVVSAVFVFYEFGELDFWSWVGRINGKRGFGVKS
jgi:hypothetical protein